MPRGLLRSKGQRRIQLDLCSREALPAGLARISKQLQDDRNAVLFPRYRRLGECTFINGGRYRGTCTFGE